MLLAELRVRGRWLPQYKPLGWELEVIKYQPSTKLPLNELSPSDLPTLNSCFEVICFLRKIRNLNWIFHKTFHKVVDIFLHLCIGLPICTSVALFVCLAQTFIHLFLCASTCLCT